MTLENIRKLGSLENAEIFIIEQEVESIIRKSYTDWIDYLRKNMKLKMNYIEPFNEKIIEIIQRRNLFVHNEGIVNNIYLNNIDPKLKEGVELGKRLSIDHAYIEESIDIFEHVGTLLGLEYWGVMEKRSSARTNYIIDKGFNLMTEGKWELSKDLHQLILNENTADNRKKSISLINYWLSMKRLGKFNEVQNEIEKSDFSDKTRDFKMSYFALLGKKDEMFDLMQEALEVNEVTLSDLRNWPVLDEFRNDERFVNLMLDEKDEVGESILEISLETKDM